VVLANHSVSYIGCTRKSCNKPVNDHIHIQICTIEFYYYHHHRHPHPQYYSNQEKRQLTFFILRIFRICFGICYCVRENKDFIIII